MDLMMIDPKFDGEWMFGRANPITPDLGVVKRACREASRDHALRDPLAEQVGTLEDLTYKMHDLAWTREDRGGRFQIPVARPWTLCRVVHVGYADTSVCPDDLYTVVVQYADCGACACYGVDANGKLRIYWN